MALGAEAEPKVDPSAGKDGAESGDQDFDRRVNAAVSSHVKRIEKRFEAKLDELRSGMSSRQETVEDDEPAPRARKQGTAKAEDEKPSGFDAQSELAKLKKELSAERAKGHEKEVLGSIKDKLSGKVKQEAMGPAIRLLKENIVIRKDGSAIFRNGEDELDIDDGLEAWLKGPEGSLFAAPPAPSRGTQKRPGSPQRAPLRSDSKDYDNMTPAQRTAAMLRDKGLY
jgi:hypothetical protein